MLGRRSVPARSSSPLVNVISSRRISVLVARCAGLVAVLPQQAAYRSCIVTLERDRDLDGFLHQQRSTRDETVLRPGAEKPEPARGEVQER